MSVRDHMTAIRVMKVVDDTDFICAHLLHRIHIFDSEYVAVNVLL
jgi:hypothetical protein